MDILIGLGILFVVICILYAVIYCAVRDAIIAAHSWLEDGNKGSHPLDAFTRKQKMYTNKEREVSHEE